MVPKKIGNTWGDQFVEPAKEESKEHKNQSGGSGPQPQTKKVSLEEIEEEKKKASAFLTKGKPTMFFYVKPEYGNDGRPSQEQALFVYDYYP
jgi:hypothetical protein